MKLQLLDLRINNPQLVIDIEEAFREAKWKAEIVAVVSVNKDLKSQEKNLKIISKKKKARKDDAHKILTDFISEHLYFFECDYYQFLFYLLYECEL